MVGKLNVRTSNNVDRRGFTLVELLIVVTIIGMLMGIMIPAAGEVREAARVQLCRNNLRQIGMAVNNYNSQVGHFPPSWKSTAGNGGSSDGWSAQALLLPHLSKQVIASKINYNQGYKDAEPVRTADGRTTKIGALRVPTFLCPSEERDEPRFSDGEASNYPINYGMNLGVWFVYDPKTGNGGQGAFYPNSRLTDQNFSDGAEFTFCAAEVKGWTPYYRNAGQDSAEIPSSPGAVSGLGGDFKTESGHTEWIDGRAHQIGFTTTFAPNTLVPADENGEQYDVDWTNQQEGKSESIKTFAAVTARSYHSGLVNVAMMGGSVRSFSDDINLGVWRAFSTRAGGEIMPSGASKN